MCTLLFVYIIIRQLCRCWWHYCTLNKWKKSTMVPLKRLNKHLPNILGNISFPFSLKSFWRLGLTFNKKTSSEELFPLMASCRLTARQQFQLGLATVDILLHWGNSQKDLWIWLWSGVLLDDIFYYISSALAGGFIQWNQSNSSRLIGKSSTEYMKSSDLQKVTDSATTKVIY